MDLRGSQSFSAVLADGEYLPRLVSSNSEKAETTRHLQRVPILLRNGSAAEDGEGYRQ